MPQTAKEPTKEEAIIAAKESAAALEQQKKIQGINPTTFEAISSEIENKANPPVTAIDIAKVERAKDEKELIQGIKAMLQAPLPSKATAPNVVEKTPKSLASLPTDETARIKGEGSTKPPDINAIASKPMSKLDPFSSTEEKESENPLWKVLNNPMLIKGLVFGTAALAGGGTIGQGFIRGFGAMGAMEKARRARVQQEFTNTVAARKLELEEERGRTGTELEKAKQLQTSHAFEAIYGLDKAKMSQLYNLNEAKLKVEIANMRSQERRLDKSLKQSGLEAQDRNKITQAQINMQGRIALLDSMLKNKAAGIQEEQFMATQGVTIAQNAAANKIASNAQTLEGLRIVTDRDYKKALIEQSAEGRSLGVLKVVGQSFTDAVNTGYRGTFAEYMASNAEAIVKTMPDLAPYFSKQIQATVKEYIKTNGDIPKEEAEQKGWFATLVQGLGWQQDVIKDTDLGFGPGSKKATQVSTPDTPVINQKLTVGSTYPGGSDVAAAIKDGSLKVGQEIDTADGGRVKILNAAGDVEILREGKVK